MKRHVTIATLFACAALTASSLWAAAPFGQIQGLQNGYTGGTGSIPLVGWALDDDGIARVDVSVDGNVVGAAVYGTGRPRVTKKYPGYVDSNGPGWVYWINTTHFLNGNHKLGAIIRSRTGESRVLPPITIQFTNNTHSLKPFGDIEFPNDQAELYGFCLSSTPRWSVISGYALDSGVEINDEGVGYVELLIDHALWANDKLDCRYLPAAGGKADCYGLRREDVSTVFPTLKDAIHSGYRFVLDVGTLIRNGWYSPGDHWLTIRAGDISGQRAQIDEIKVTFNCAEDIPNQGGFGFIETPNPGYSYHDGITVTGWALDWEHVQSVTVLVDGVVQGVATYGLLRTDVASWYPGYFNNPNAGWTFNLDTTQTANGRHFIQAIITDFAGQTALIGERLIYIGNP